MHAFHVLFYALLRVMEITTDSAKLAQDINTLHGIVDQESGENSTEIIQQAVTILDSLAVALREGGSEVDGEHGCDKQSADSSGTAPDSQSDHSSRGYRQNCARSVEEPA